MIENTPIPEPIPEQEGLPENVPRMTMGGKPVKRWAPKRRVY